MTGRRERLPLRDLSWRDTRMIRVLGGFPMPDEATLRARLAALSGTRFASEVDLATGRLRPPASVDAFLDQAVIRSPARLDDGVDALAAEVRALRPGPVPIRMLLGDDWAAAHYTHVLGDGSVMWRLLCALLGPDGDVGDLVRAGIRLPLARAVASTFVASPSRALRMARSERHGLPVSAAAGGPTTLASVTRRSDATVRQLVGDRPAGTRTPAYLISLAADAAQQAGLSVHPGVAMLADLRRYLPAGATVTGNFAAGSFLGVPDLTDPMAVTRAVDSLLDTGRPLLALTASTLRTRRRPAGEDGFAGDDGRTVLSFSLNRRQQPPAGVAADALRMALVGKPLGPHGISLSLSEIGDRLHATATFHPRHVSPGQAAAVVERVTSRGG